ncbi:hypothetical protein [Coleofasciculus sp. F4-SAH-05]|uniref:hypothetical protein n=1 Tax=Coleofasciculus sp. F4-SAH-05 TaxID=3069525 RepID=UPI003303B15B
MVRYISLMHPTKSAIALLDHAVWISRAVGIEVQFYDDGEHSCRASILIATHTQFKCMTAYGVAFKTDRGHFY